MTELILFAVSCIGLTLIVTSSKLLEPVRGFLDRSLPASVASLFHCNQCFGFWSGLFCYLLVFGFTHPLYILLGGFAGSFVSSFGGLYLDYLEALTVISMGDDEPEV